MVVTVLDSFVFTTPAFSTMNGILFDLLNVIAWLFPPPESLHRFFKIFSLCSKWNGQIYQMTQSRNCSGFRWRPLETSWRIIQLLKMLTLKWFCSQFSKQMQISASISPIYPLLNSKSKAKQILFLWKSPIFFLNPQLMAISFWFYRVHAMAGCNSPAYPGSWQC